MATTTNIRSTDRVSVPSRQRLPREFDWVLLLLVVLVGALGLVNLYSSTWTGEAGLVPGASSFVIRQGIFFGIGLVVIGALLIFDYDKLKIGQYFVYVLVLGLLIFALVKGQSIANTQRWIRLGFFNLQPSEPAKFATVLTLAAYYSNCDVQRGLGLRQLLLPLILTGVPSLLILKQPDLGTALILVAIFATMTVYVGLRLSSLIVLGSLAAGVIALAWKFYLKPYQKQRVESFLNPGNDPMQHSYQVEQSKIAVGSGQLFGKGYLEGTQGHLHFLPEKHTDFAFAVWSEEWGFAGCCILVTIYCLLLLWSLNVALSARDRFGSLLAFGMVSMIFCQAFINMAMIMGLLPVVGIPLPLFSYGGSSLLTTLAGIGVLLNISLRRGPV
ncbi:MAG: rod shape-determining protein RodA [Desulfobulbaceae bacterium A2]|nr:MAG: rod shape-determining protein RodA [Desulfobulbaceae bacterium A2]